MSKSGWIKVYRKIEDCPFWFEERFTYGQAWIDLLLMANHASKRILFDATWIEIQQGQILTSIRKLSTRWGWGVKRTMRFLDNLAADNMVIRESNTKRTLITIVNYSVYQSSGNTNENADNNTDDNTDDNTDCTQTRREEDKNNIHVAPKEQRESDKADFEVIYSKYPKKKSGRGRALNIYLGWTSQKGRYVNGHYVKLTREQIWKGVQTYCKQQYSAGCDMQYWKNIDTLMNQILDYIGGEDG